MSAFQVHGVSRHDIYDKLKRTVGDKKQLDDKSWIYLDEAGWIAEVERLTDEKFAKAKPSAISPKYDSPRFAEEYVRQCANDPHIRDLQVMALTPTGAIDPETKLPVLKWMPYTPGINAKQVA